MAFRRSAGGHDEEPPIDLKSLRGKVVLIDFWAYSCINCQRSVPHVTAWEEAYRDDGLVVIGVHTPEYAFERETRNVVDGAQRLGITYPVAQDNSYATWTAYRNRYWPAHYLIDADGQIRQVSQGEGGYANTEALIRELLEQADPGVDLPAVTQVDDTTPVGDVTRETFLSVSKRSNVAGDYREGEATYTLPQDQAADSVAFGGTTSRIQKPLQRPSSPVVGWTDGRAPWIVPMRRAKQNAVSPGSRSQRINRSHHATIPGRNCTAFSVTW